MNPTVKGMSDYLNLFNGIMIPPSNMGIRRPDMPQIISTDIPEFLRFMKSHGVSAQKLKVFPSDLKLCQNELNKFKVLDLARLNQTNNYKPNPLLVSSDSFVIDGSHRLVADYNFNQDKQIEIWKFNRPIKTILELAKLFLKSQFRSHSDRVLGK